MTQLEVLRITFPIAAKEVGKTETCIIQIDLRKLQAYGVTAQPPVEYEFIKVQEKSA